jgi:glycosyltransferase involved in cell wall biosynthesis
MSIASRGERIWPTATSAPGEAQPGRSVQSNGAKPRMLMMAGADYVPDHPSFVSMVHELARSARYSLNAFGVNGCRASASQENQQVFETVTAFPTVSLRPKSIPEAARLIRDALASAVRRWPRTQRPLLTPPSGLSRAARLQYQILLERMNKQVPAATRGYDIYHWHTLEPERLAALAFVPPEAKIVLSPWGSDLLRTAGLDAYRMQLWACERASRLVVYSLELRETLLAKFGRHLLPKMRLASIGGGLFDAVDRARPVRAEFRRSLNIADDKVLACLGNNGHPSNQHVAVLRALGRLDDRDRARLTVILPMTYGAADEYVRAVNDAASSAGVDVRVLRERMTDSQTACLRAATDILLFVPVSDSLSAALCEVLAAGGVAITGAWLPYGLLRREGIHFHEVADIADIPARLSEILGDLKAERTRAAATGPRVKNLKAWDRVINQWIAIYDELLCS